MVEESDGTSTGNGDCGAIVSSDTHPDNDDDDDDDDDDDNSSTAASDANDNADTVGVKLVDDAPMTTTAGSSRGTTLRVIRGTGPGFCGGCSSSCRLDAAALFVVSIYHWPAMMMQECRKECVC